MCSLKYTKFYDAGENISRSLGNWIYNGRLKCQMGDVFIVIFGAVAKGPRPLCRVCL